MTRRAIDFIAANAVRGLLPAQASVSQVVAVVAAAVGLVWVFVGFAQAGMPAVAQGLVAVGTLSSAVVAVVLVRRRGRRRSFRVCVNP